MGYQLDRIIRQIEQLGEKQNGRGRKRVTSGEHQAWADDIIARSERFRKALHPEIPYSELVRQDDMDYHKEKIENNEKMAARMMEIEGSAAIAMAQALLKGAAYHRRKLAEIEQQK